MRHFIIPALLLASPAPAQGPLFDADGYRIAHYRAPVRQPPAGVGRIAPAAAAQLVPDRDAIFIDVLPTQGGHREPGGRWRLASPHESIPGAHWFPEAGRGQPDPAIAQGFARGLARLTRGQRSRMLILFCRADCWMGWNATKRLRAMGYANIWWLAEGTDGWRDLGLPLAPVQPDGGITP
ncbi:Rhodanese-related sulfurtransferase [Sphingobium indicum BiD32]|uniref:Rhodanese-related sulfurtransferase n=1 Tax=Sphingobium indicum BiD32 TaxID=1301087 RepID=N1MS13_9SPHN|nr:rhodanese-like domain-containing protein [Sphingobium indicum]CCW19524.1 Rhodanese-related sulfurtransferase [Sphingobium indicum BiD32]